MRTLKGRPDATQVMAAWSPGNPRGNKTPLPNAELCRAMQGYYMAMYGYVGFTGRNFKNP